MALTSKFKLEKIQYTYEQRFSQEFTAREIEWEKAFEKKDDLLTQRDKIIKDLEQDKSGMKDFVTKLEIELASLKT